MKYVIDHTGNVIYKDGRLSSFHPPYRNRCVITHEDGKKGLIDIVTSQEFPGRWHSFYGFGPHGLAVVCNERPSDREHTYNLIDINGNELLHEWYDGLQIGDSYVITVNRDNRYYIMSLLDPKQTLIPKQGFQCAEKPAYGLIPVILDDERCGWVDDHAQIVLGPYIGITSYESVFNEDGIARYCDVRYGFMKNQAVYINIHGRELLRLCISDGPGSFSSGLCPLCSIQPNCGKYGYIDITGRYVIPPKYDMAFSFQVGYAEVEIHKSKYIINTSGQLIHPDAGIYGRYTFPTCVGRDRRGFYLIDSTSGRRISKRYYKYICEYKRGMAIAEE